MNKIWCPIMNTVIVAIMAKALTVVYIVSEFGIILNKLYMMGFKVLMAATYLTGKIVTFKYGLFPSQVFGTSATLILPIVFAFGNTLAFYTTVSAIVILVYSSIKHVRIWSPKLFTTNITSASRRVGKSSTFTAAIDRATNMRWGATNNLLAMLTNNLDFLRLRFRATTSRAEPFFIVLCPTAIRLFGNDLATKMTSY